MITLKIDPSRSKDYSKLMRTSKGGYIAIQKKLGKWLINNPAHADRMIVSDIKRNIKKILTGNPKDLEFFISDYISKGYQSRIFDPTTGELTTFGNEIKKTFNYKSFRKSKKALWFAKASTIKSCTTCNTQYTLTTSQANGEKLLFHLDHYFPQSVYPYLSLSYYNLIPCCDSCNMSKSNKPFKLKENIHPYIESFHEIAKFKIDKPSLLKFMVDPNRNEQEINFSVELRAKFFADPIYELKLKNYLKEFRINEQYLQFKDVVSETYLKSLFYNKVRRNELINFFENTSTPLNHELIKRFILGNYHQEKDLLKRPLAKFMRDLGEEFNLI